jgi:hypothetical protein
MEVALWASGDAVSSAAGCIARLTTRASVHYNDYSL